MTTSKNKIFSNSLVRRVWETNKLKSLYLIYQLCLFSALIFLQPGRRFGIALYKRWLRSQATLISGRNDTGLENDPRYVEYWSSKRDFIKRAMAIYKEKPVESKYVTFFDTQNVRVKISYESTQSRILVVIRGSSNSENWHDNLDMDMGQNLLGSGRIHSEYNRIANKIFLETSRCLASKFYSIDPSTPIVVVGHSLGGALAALVGMYLEESGQPVEWAINVGGPCFSTGDFASKKVFNVFDLRDPVPYLPVATLGRSYNPHGVRVLIDPDTGFFDVQRECWASDKFCSPWLLSNDVTPITHMEYDKLL